MAYFYKEFVDRTFESRVNEKSLYYNYTFPQNEVLEYVHNILEIPIQEIVEEIKNSNEEIQLAAKDVMQFSSFDDATIRMCQVLKEIDNPGVTYIEAGKLLLNDGQERKDGAYTKYGENHLKTSAIIGLTFELTNTYFLSSLGQVVDVLSDDEAERLITRLILRGPLVKRLIRASGNGKVDVRSMLYMLSDSTYVRRRSNMRSIFKQLQDSKEYDFTHILENLVW